MATDENLVTSVGSRRLRFLKPPPSPRPGVALVVDRQGHDPVTIYPSDRMTMGEVAWGRSASFYEVVISERTFGFACKLPCKSDAFHFTARADVTYKVEDPSMVVSNDRIADGRELVERMTLDVMRAKSREFEVEQSAEAEAAISQAVLNTAHEPPSGLKVVRYTVALELEEEARTFIRDLKILERNKAYELGQSELEKQRLELAQELDKRKLDFYGPLVRGGHWELLTYCLAKNPDKVEDVAAKLRELDAETLDRQMAFLETLSEKGMVEGFDVGVTAQRLLSSLVESLRTGPSKRSLSGGESIEALEAASSEMDSLDKEDDQTDAHTG